MAPYGSNEVTPYAALTLETSKLQATHVDQLTQGACMVNRAGMSPVDPTPPTIGRPVRYWGTTHTDKSASQTQKLTV
jgi:hypothetical protein